MHGEPDPPPPGTFGYDPRTGVYRHPTTAPHSETPHPFPGSLDFLDLNEYRANTKVEAYLPHVVGTGHTWMATFDMNGRRYMYDYNRGAYKVFDISNVRRARLLKEWQIDRAKGEHPFGPFTARWNRKLNKLIAVQCYEVPRYGVLENKYRQPDKVQAIRQMRILRGFRIFELTSPTDWKLLSETTLDPYNAANEFPQQGSGCLDVPAYFGDKYLFVAGAPDDSYALQEYPSVLYSAAHIAYDVSDPTNPKKLGVWSAPGQQIGEEDAYKKNARAGNKTSWMGARMAFFIPKAVEDGGRYAYTSMGGLGFFIVDISDPTNMRTVSHLPMPPSVAGNEGDNVDISQVEATGFVYYSGYPMNNDCYEPYKEIYVIDVRDKTAPRIVNALPRPVPPRSAPFTDFCQRRGSFGPKRTGYYAQHPGTPAAGLLPYAFYNAGLQVFDVNDPLAPQIAAYFVPKMVDAKMNLDFGNVVHGIYVEWDRRLIWVMSNHGNYAVSTKLLGKPQLTMPVAQ
jgi:LVIVD repeat